MILDSQHMTSILRLEVGVPIAVDNITHTTPDVDIQVIGTDERDQKGKIRTDQKEIRVRGIGAATAVIIIGREIVGAGTAIETEKEECQMIPTIEMAAHKTEVEFILIGQEVNVVGVIGATIMLSDTAIPEKKPLLVDTRGILQRQEILLYRMMRVAGVGEVPTEETVAGGEPHREGSHNVILSNKYLILIPLETTKLLLIFPANSFLESQSPGPICLFLCHEVY